MRKIYNERHVQKEEMATNLDILRELNKRRALDDDLYEELLYLEAKERSLNIVLDYINEYAQEHWLYMMDVSLDAYNILTCDLLLVTSVEAYTFEINHYYEGFELASAAVKKAQSIASQLKSLSLMNSIHLNVQGAAIFTGTDTLEIEDSAAKNIDILTTKQLDKYLSKIVKKENDYQGPAMNSGQHLRWFGEIDRHRPAWQMTIPAEIKNNIQKGILCSHCESFDVTLGDPYISCECGMHESLEEAIVRTICEFGVLNNDLHLSVPELLDFFDYQISEDDLYKHLDKHFAPVG